MTLTALVAEFAAVTGGTGFGLVIKSTETGNKFTVDYKLPTGKFVITRTDNGKSFIVEGNLVRYESVMSIGLVGEMRAEVIELEEQKGIIEGRLATLKSELSAVGLVG